MDHKPTYGPLGSLPGSTSGELIHLSFLESSEDLGDRRKANQGSEWEMRIGYTSGEFPVATEIALS